jgi:hypothetical protein
MKTNCENECQTEMSKIRLLPGNMFMKTCMQNCITDTENTESKSPLSKKNIKINWDKVMKGGSSYNWGDNNQKKPHLITAIKPNISPPSTIKIPKLLDLQIPPTIPKLPNVPEVQPDQMLAVENDTVLYKSCGWLPFGWDAVKATDNEIIEQIYIKPYD